MEQKLESLRKKLNKIAAEHKYENYELILNELSSGGANYSSKLFTVIIREENKNDLHLFAKVIVLGEKILEGMPEMPQIDIEPFVYKKLSKVYASLEEENGVPEEHRLHFTKSYELDDNGYQEILILDNLLAQGYRPFDRFHAYDWEYASSAVSGLAKMHALSFAFSEKYPEEFKKTLADIKMNWEGNETINKMTQKMVNIALNDVKPEFRDLLEKFMEDKPSAITMTGAITRPTIIHGDFRGDNLVHRVRDGTVEIKILDFQTLQGGSPVIDLIYFIVTGSDGEFRTKYYEKLLDHYYAELSAAMKRLHLDPQKIYSREDFEYELKEKMPYGLCVAMFVLPIVTVNTTDAPEVNESLGLSDFAVEKTSDLYRSRLNELVRDYIKWGILK